MSYLLQESITTQKQTSYGKIFPWFAIDISISDPSKNILSSVKNDCKTFQLKT